RYGVAFMPHNPRKGLRNPPSARCARNGRRNAGSVLRAKSWRLFLADRMRRWWLNLLHLGLLGLPRFAVPRFAIARFGLGAHFGIRRGGWSGRAMTLPIALRIHDAKIMLRVLVQIFRRDPIAARLRLSRHCQIALEHLVGVAADLNARTVALETLHPVRHVRAVGMRPAPAAMRTTAASVTTA